MVRIVTVQFDYGENRNYDLLLKVMELSIAINMPRKTVLDIVQSPAPPYTDKRLPIGLTTNTKKLEYWIRLMDEAKDGERLIFMDCDMLVLGDMEEAFDRKQFDIGYTVRQSGFPLNGGVLFVNVNPSSREFMHLWKKANDDMFADPTLLGPWRRKYAGMNQASFGYMLEKGKHQSKLVSFSCGEFNSCDDTWAGVNDKTKALHIKGTLRKACLDYAIYGKMSHIKKIINPLRLWISYYSKLKKTYKKKSSGVNFIITHFDYDSDGVFSKLADVLQYSISKNVPGSRVIREVLQAPEDPNVARSFLSNTLKLESWMQVLWGLEEESKVVFIDADTLVTGDITPLFDQDFDIAYTSRTHSSFPINGGVIFVKRNERAILFLQKFKEVNNEMFNDREFHKIWQKKYAGMNQAAFGWMLENYKKPVKLLSVPCSIYNACNEDWPKLKGEEKIIHIKGGLRKYLFSDQSKEINISEFGPALPIWRKYREEYLKDHKQKD